MIPKKVIDCIDEHLVKAETKHPVFCNALIPKRLKGNHFKKSVKEAIKLCDLTGSAYDVINEELNEIFEAIESDKIDSARAEIYDTIATLLRLDKAIEESPKNGLLSREL
jgi:hypothetical protein